MKTLQVKPSTQIYTYLAFQSRPHGGGLVMTPTAGSRAGRESWLIGLRARGRTHGCSTVHQGCQVSANDIIILI